MGLRYYSCSPGTPRHPLNQSSLRVAFWKAEPAGVLDCLCLPVGPGSVVLSVLQLYA